MPFKGTNKAITCLEVDQNEEIFIPNIYDMFLIQNFWDSLEMRYFRIFLRPKGFVSNKNSIKEPDINNNEIINENQENKDYNELLLEKKEKKNRKKKDILFFRIRQHFKDTNLIYKSNKLKKYFPFYYKIIPFYLNYIIINNQKVPKQRK